MAIKQPVIIAAPPRCGTTMLSGLLYLHGYWVGRARTTMYPGTNPEFAAENQDIKGLMKQQAKRLGYENWHTPFPNPLLEGQSAKLKQEIEQIIPKNTKWLINTSWTLVFWKTWNELFPEAKWVLAKRPAEDIVASMNRHPGMRRHPDEEKESFVHHLQGRQNDVHRNVNTIKVDVKRLSGGLKQEIEALFQFIGTEPKWDEINTWIKPKLMQ